MLILGVIVHHYSVKAYYSDQTSKRMLTLGVIAHHYSIKVYYSDQTSMHADTRCDSSPLFC